MVAGHVFILGCEVFNWSGRITEWLYAGMLCTPTQILKIKLNKRWKKELSEKDWINILVKFLFLPKKW